MKNTQISGTLTSKGTRRSAARTSIAGYRNALMIRKSAAQCEKDIASDKYFERTLRDKLERKKRLKREAREYKSPRKQTAENAKFWDRVTTFMSYGLSLNEAKEMAQQ